MPNHRTASAGVTLSRRGLGAILLGGSIAWLQPRIATGAAVPAPLNFDVYRKGDTIGSHRVNFEPDAEGFIARTTVSLAVKVAFVVAYRYEQSAVDTWRKRDARSLGGADERRWQAHGSFGRPTGPTARRHWPAWPDRPSARGHDRPLLVEHRHHATQGDFGRAIGRDPHAQRDRPHGRYGRDRWSPDGGATVRCRDGGGSKRQHLVPGGRALAFDPLQHAR